MIVQSGIDPDSVQFVEPNFNVVSNPYSSIVGTQVIPPKSIPTENFVPGQTLTNFPVLLAQTKTMPNSLDTLDGVATIEDRHDGIVPELAPRGDIRIPTVSDLGYNGVDIVMGGGGGYNPMNPLTRLGVTSGQAVTLDPSLMRTDLIGSGSQVLTLSPAPNIGNTLATANTGQTFAIPETSVKTKAVIFVVLVLILISMFAGRE